MAQGKKTGGRRKGSRNKAAVIRERNIAASGEMPVDYMLRVMRDPSQAHSRRDEMAKAAAPYLHRKLAALDVDTNLNVTMSLEAMIVQSYVISEGK